MGWKMTTTTKLLLFLLLFGLFIGTAFAGDDGPHSTDVTNDTTVISNNHSVVDSASNNAYDAWSVGLSNSLGDVDINQCLASVQWNTVLVGRQKVVLNKWCAAEVYDAKGLYTMAAIMRCDIEEISRHFPDRDRCIEANTIDARATASAMVPIERVIEEREEIEEAHQRDLLQQQEVITGLEQRLAKIEQRKPRPTSTVNSVGLTDEQRVQIAEVFKR